MIKFTLDSSHVKGILDNLNPDNGASLIDEKVILLKIENDKLEFCVSRNFGKTRVYAQVPAKEVESDCETELVIGINPKALRYIDSASQDTAEICIEESSIAFKHHSGHSKFRFIEGIRFPVLDVDGEEYVSISSHEYREKIKLMTGTHFHIMKSDDGVCMMSCDDLGHRMSITPLETSKMSDGLEWIDIPQEMKKVLSDDDSPIVFRRSEKLVSLTQEYESLEYTTVISYQQVEPMSIEGVKNAMNKMSVEPITTAKDQWDLCRLAKKIEKDGIPADVDISFSLDKFDLSFGRLSEIAGSVEITQEGSVIESSREAGYRVNASLLSFLTHHDKWDLISGTHKEPLFFRPVNEPQELHVVAPKKGD